MAALALVAAARLVAWDSRSVLVGLDALTPVLFLPAWPVAVAAAAGRRPWLCTAATLVVVAHIGFMLPELSASTPVAAAARSAPSFRLFDANVFTGNTDAAGYAAEITRQRPDLVILEEPTPAFVAALEQTGALAPLPYRLEVSRSDPFTSLVASRWPLRDADVLSVDGRPITRRATIDPAGRSLQLLAVHVVAPLGGDRAEWARELRAVRDAVAAASASGPVLVAGDFNATWGNRPFRALLDAGLTDAAAARGEPLEMTWPRNIRVVPAMLRIDHVLTTRGLTVTRIRTGSGHGSDHRPLVADVVLA
ncbi:MAG: endonuclease/exonuclease/phosphatase family protein [Actinomycetota bacterium]|nr:endonuclease/exonuclease/phosphatase family protein [Actinomycetota bacterium]